MSRESGSALIETGITLLLAIMLSAGVIDASRGFYQYDVVGAAAQYGARWASVVGGLCGAPDGASSSDWCDQFGGTAKGFWSQPGNHPLQAGGVSCPHYLDQTFTGYYTVGDYHTGTATTIVGAIGQHFDTSSSSPGFVHGELVPGLVLSSLKVCIQMTWNSATSEWSTQPGDKVQVWAYYPYRPVTGLLSPVHEVDLVGSAEYRID